MFRKTVISALMGFLLAAPAAAQEASLEEVLSNYYEAIGGVDAWQTVQSYKSTGTRMMGPGIEAPFTAVLKRPGKIRIDFTVQGMTGTMAFDGETAWMFLPFMGRAEPEPMPDFMAEGFRTQSDIDGPLVGYEEDGHQIELLGLEEIEGTAAYKLKVTLKSGEVQHWYLDSEYFVPIKFTGSQTMQGREVEYETTLSDYKEVEGLMMVHSITTSRAESPDDIITIETIELNVEVDDASFSMPETGGEGQQ